MAPLHVQAGGSNGIAVTYHNTLNLKWLRQRGCASTCIANGQYMNTVTTLGGL